MVVPADCLTQDKHPLDGLSSEEVRRAAAATRNCKALASKSELRFVSVTLLEPSRPALQKFNEAVASGADPAHALPPRIAEVILITPETGLAHVAHVQLAAGGQAADELLKCEQQAPGAQPCFMPDDCLLAEEIAKADPELQVRTTASVH